MKDIYRDLAFISAVVVCFSAYLFWKPIETFLKVPSESEGMLFYVMIPVSFSLFSYGWLLTIRESWKVFPKIVIGLCVTRVLLEITNPEDGIFYDIWEYLGAFITVFTIVMKYFYDHYIIKKVKDE